MRVVAVDWSGKQKRAEEYLWIAEVCDGELVDLRNGLTLEALVERLIEGAEAEPHGVIGFDFAFSFPRWWCEERGWTSVQEGWKAMAADGESVLSECEHPFWGRPGRPNPHTPERLYRRTDREGPVGIPKSVFQIGGAGAVGTGSIRGMPRLLRLAERGFGVWPFFEGSPRVLEIYPRALTGPVRKASWADRHAFLFRRFPAQPAELLERAAGSEDAFDAAVSALVMEANRRSLASLTQMSDPDYSIEGKIWRPDEGA